MPKVSQPSQPSSNAIKNVVVILSVLVLLIAVSAATIFLLNKNSSLFSSLLPGKAKSPYQIELSTLSKSGTLDKKNVEVNFEIENSEIILKSAPDSVVGSATVTLTSVTNLIGLPAGAAFVKGVQIDSPDAFIKQPLTLSMEIPKEMAGKILRGVSYDDNQENLHYYPVEIKGNIATFPIVHFSGYGIVALEDKDMKLFELSDVGFQAESDIANIVSENQSKADQRMSSTQDQELVDIFRVWRVNGVNSKINAGMGNSDYILDAIQEYITWRQLIQFYDLENSLTTEIQASSTLLAKMIQVSITKTAVDCTQMQDPTKGSRLMKIASIIDTFNLDGKEGISLKVLETKIKNCVNFKMTFKSYVSTEGNSQKCGGQSFVSGEVNFSMGDNFKLRGDGEFTVDREILCDIECKFDRPEVHKVEIVDTPFVATKPGDNEIAIKMQVSLADDPHYICEFNEDGSLGTDTTTWNAEFDVIHKNEFLGYFDTGMGGSIFQISDWDIVSEGDVFARKTYKRKVRGINNGMVDENTTFELIHTPK